MTVNFFAHKMLIIIKGLFRLLILSAVAVRFVVNITMMKPTLVIEDDTGCETLVSRLSLVWYYYCIVVHGMRYVFDVILLL